jgi:uncharacterized protein YjbI with pentapeptide repeats
VSSTGWELRLNVERFGGLGCRPAERFVGFRRTVLDGPEGRFFLGDRTLGRLRTRGGRLRRGFSVSRPGRRRLIVVVGQTFAEPPRRSISPPLLRTVWSFSVAITISISIATLGRTTLGRSAFGRTTFRQAAFGESTFGQSAFGRTTFRQSAFGESTFGQAAFGRTTFRQSAFGESAFGEPPFGHSTFGQPSLGRSAFGRTISVAPRRFAVAPWVVDVATRLARAVAGAEVALVAQVFAIVLGLDVGDVKESIAADGKVDEGGLDGRLEIDDLSLVDVSGVALVAGSLEVQFFEHAILNDGDATFLRLEDVNQHLFLHAVGLS